MLQVDDEERDGRMGFLRSCVKAMKIKAASAKMVACICGPRWANKVDDSFCTHRRQLQASTAAMCGTTLA